LLDIAAQLLSPAAPDCTIRLLGTLGADQTRRLCAMGDDRHDKDASSKARQVVHAATGDRDAEAEALADRAGEDVDADDAKVAVQRAHGDRSDPDAAPKRGLADADDAQQAADEGTR
jgi:hypothetical protein